jgi:hypothetical protein
MLTEANAVKGSERPLQALYYACAGGESYKWQPHFDDPRTIVTHALAWELKLSKRT